MDKNSSRGGNSNQKQGSMMSHGQVGAVLN